MNSQTWVMITKPEDSDGEDNDNDDTEPDFDSTDTDSEQNLAAITTVQSNDELIAYYNKPIVMDTTEDEFNEN